MYAAANDTDKDAAPRTGMTLGIPGGVSVLVIRAPAGAGVLTCGGEVLLPQRPPACSARAGFGTIRPGERFTDPASGLEVVCTRAGCGTLAFGGRPLGRS